MSFPYFLHCGFTDEIEEITKTAAIATKTDPAKWEQAKRDAKARMGGKHSARAMQLATQLYKKRGGGYSGAKPSAKNNSLKKWGKQKWQWSKEKSAMMMGPKPPMMPPRMPGMSAPMQPGMSAPMPSYAKGGIVKYKKGGKIVRVAEKGDEAIIPLEDKKNAKRIAKKILKRR